MCSRPLGETELRSCAFFFTRAEQGVQEFLPALLHPRIQAPRTEAKVFQPPLTRALSK